MNKPDGKKILQLLIDLYSEQEGVKTNYATEAAA